MNKKVSLVITDLDNTLYDWLSIWYASFSAMLEEVVRISGVDADTLKKEFRAVFQKHGTSEYAFSLRELPSLLAKTPVDEITTVYASAITAYQTARRAKLECYPDVLETLAELKERGCVIVAYTESMSFYTKTRLRRLGLDLILDYLYSPADHELPDNVTREEIRRYPAERYELRKTRHKFTPPGELKPNPKVLRDIINDVGGEEGRTIYIGDNKMKDVTMAQEAGITDVWAAYGAGQHLKEYELLRSVSHWPETTVQKEKTVTVSPSITLQKSFKEVLSLFKFVAFAEPDRMDNVVDMWKTTVGVQQHFNDLELRIRNYAVTLLVAILGVTAVALKDKSTVGVFGFNTTLAPLLLFAGLVGWMAFYFMDRYWYHRLLKGAVVHGDKIESAHCFGHPEIALTKAISEASPIKLPGYRHHKRTLRTTGKIDVFYLSVAGALLSVIVVMMASTYKAPSTLGDVKTNAASTLLTNSASVVNEAQTNRN